MLILRAVRRPCRRSGKSTGARLPAPCAPGEKIISQNLLDIAGVVKAEIDHTAGSGFVETATHIEDAVIVQTIKKAGYQAEINERQGQNPAAMEIEKKMVGSYAPFKIKMESTVEADGNFSSESNTPNYAGKITYRKKGDFEIPENRADIEGVVDN